MKKLAIFFFMSSLSLAPLLLPASALCEENSSTRFVSTEHPLPLDGISNPLVAYAAGVEGGTAYLIENYDENGEELLGRYVLAVGPDGQRKWLTELTDEMGDPLYSLDEFVFLWPVGGGRLVVTREGLYEEALYQDISFLVLDGEGGIAKAATEITTGQPYSHSARVAELPGGRFAVVYASGGSGYLQIFNSSGNRVLGPDPIPRDGSCFLPKEHKIAANQGGNFIVTYDCARPGGDMSTQPYFAVLYDSEGNPVQIGGSEYFHPTENGVGSDAQQAVAPLTDGNFVFLFLGNYVNQFDQEEYFRIIQPDGEMGDEIPSGRAGMVVQDLIPLREGGFVLSGSAEEGIVFDRYDNEGNAVDPGWVVDPVFPDSWWMIYTGYDEGFGIWNDITGRMLNFTPAEADPVNFPPTISGLPPATVPQGGLFSFTPEAADPEGEPLTFSITTPPKWAEFDPQTGELSGIPGNDDVGTTTGIVLSVTDAAGATAELTPFDITVVNVNDPPEIAVGSPLILPRGGDIVLTSAELSASDIDSGTSPADLSFVVVTAPAGGRLLISGTQLLTGGTFTPEDLDDNMVEYVHDGGTEPSDSFQVVVRDPGGAESAPATLTFTVDAPPQLTLSMLEEGSFTSEAAQNVAGGASDDYDIPSVSVNGEPAVLTDGEFSHALTLVEGENVITVAAADGRGSVTTLTRTVWLDSTVPKVTIETPADNSLTGEREIVLSGTVDEAVDSVTVRIGEEDQSVSLLDGKFSTTVLLAEGINTVDVIALDRAGNLGSAKRTVTYDAHGPDLAITEPAQDIRVEEGQVTISGTVSDDYGTAEVTIRMGEQTYTPEINQGTFSQNLLLPEPGMYSILVTARDEVGNTSGTTTRNIIYDPRPLGDVNGDRIVDTADALLTLRIAVGLEHVEEEHLSYGDVAPLVQGRPAPDRRLSAVDALVILRKIVGQLDF